MDDDKGSKFVRRTQAFLATAITIGFFAVIAALFWMKEIPSSVKDILLVLLGALLASWKEVTGYFFGSSSGSAKKDDQNAALAAQLGAAPPPIPPAPIVPPVVKIDSQDGPVPVEVKNP